MRLSDDDNVMLGSIAKSDGATESDVVRRLIRQEYGARGLTTPAQPVVQAWDAFEREHRVFGERYRLAREKKKPAPPYKALEKVAIELTAIARREPYKVGDVHRAVQWYQSGLSDTNRPNPEPGFAQTLEAFDELWSQFDRWIDELKTQT